MSARQAPWWRTRAWDDLTVAVPALLVYWQTLAPSITTGDSGELVTAAATLSLAHPTGYPLYLLLGHVFIAMASTLSFGAVSPALAMNFFSALTAVAACVVLRRLTESLLRDRVAAAATALLFAFSTSMWSQATTARVYALSALLVVLVLFEILRRPTKERGSLALAWFYFGLGMANHTVMIVLAPLLLIASTPSGVGWASRARATLWCVPGLALYAYVPIAASSNPVQNWGDPSVAQRLIPYLSRESFWSKRYLDEAGDLWSIAAHYLDQIPVELTWLGALLFIVGLASRARRRGVVALGLYLFAANALLVALHGSRQDIFYWSRYLITGWLGLTLIAGTGLERILRELRDELPLRPRMRRAVVLGVAALAPLASLLLGWERADRSHDVWAHDFAAAILEGLEPDALLFAEEDNVLFPLSYLHHVERMRPDVELVMQGINRLESKRIAPDQRATYFTHPRNLGSDALELIPDGLAFRLLPKGSGFRGRPWQQTRLESFESVRSAGTKRYLDRSLVGNYYFLEALNREREEPEAALRAANWLHIVSFDNAVNQVNAGLLFERNLHFESALECFEAAAGLDPKNELAVGRSRFWRETLAQASAVIDADARKQLVAEALLQIGRVDLAMRLLAISTTQP